MPLSESVLAPPTFPVHGLAASIPTGERALDEVAAYRTTPADELHPYGIWLGHRADDGTWGVRVGTFAIDAIPTEAPAIDVPTRDPYSLSARIGMNALIDVTMPYDGTSMAPEPGRGTIKRISAHGRAVAANADEWHPVSWTIDGVPVTGRYYEFAGAWTGFVILGTLSVIAVGVGLPPNGLALTQVANTEPYGFTTGEPIDPGYRKHGTRQWHDTIIPLPNQQWHTDQLTLTRPTGT